MKNVRKMSVILIISVMLMCFGSINVFATTTTQDGLEATLTTDKSNYGKDDKISVTMTVKNTNADSVENVSLEAIVPNGYAVADNSSKTKNVGTLKSGETSTLEISYIPVKESATEENVVVNTISANTVNTGDTLETIFIIIGLLGISGGLIVFLLKNKKAKAFLSLLLVVSILGSSSVVLSFKTHAVDNNKNIGMTASVKVENSELKINAKIYYVMSEKLKDFVTVSFESNGGSDVASMTVSYGSTISAPEAPTKEGYIFVGWYVNSKYDEMFLFDEDVITDNVTLYADWISDDPDSVRAEWILDSIIIKYAQGDTANNVTRDITLPENIEDTDISWNSSNTTVVGKDGKVNRVNEEDTDIVLTASVSVGNKTLTKSYSIKVIGKSTAISLEDYSVVDIQNMNEDGEVNIEYNDDRTQVTAIEGKYSNNTVNNSEDALMVLQNIRTIIGLESAFNELVLTNTDHDEYGAAYSFDQYQKGYRVFGRNVMVSVDENGVTDILNSTLIHSRVLDTLNTESIIDVNTAENVVKQKFGNNCSVKSDKTECVIYSFDEYINNPVIAYIIYVSGIDDFDKPFKNKIILNAVDKSFIEISSLLLEDVKTGSGKDERGNKVSFPVYFTWTDWYFYYMFDPDTNVQIYDDSLGNGIINEYLLDKDYRVGSEFNKWEDGQQISAYTNMMKVQKWWGNTFGRNSLDNNGMKVNVVTHNTDLYNNAFWDPDEQKIFITDISGSVVKYSRAVADDVLTHESTHAVLQYELGSDFAEYYYNAPGAINEGYADIFGCLENGNWTHGENLYTSQSISNGQRITCTRNIANPTDMSALSQGPDKLSSSFYIDYTKDQSDNGGVHTNGFLVSHAAYLMSKNGISNEQLAKLWYKSIKLKKYTIDSDFHTVRNVVIQAAKKIHLTDTEMYAVRKAFDDEEIYSERGNISIKFVDADGRTMTEKVDVSVSMQRNEEDAPQPILTIDTDTLRTAGKNDIYFGTYTTKIRIPGYKSFEAKVIINEGETTELVVPVIAEGNGFISGTVTSATTGYAVDSVNMKVYDGWYKKEGTAISSTVSDSNGQYKFTLPAGYYTIEMSKEGYTTGYFNISIAGGKELTNQNVSLSPNMEFTKDFRVVLTWGENPSDLDSHLIGKLADGSSYHVYYSDKNGYDSSYNKVANLDVDDTTSYGPETVTFTAETDGEYEYYVHWYNGTGTWATSGGKVEVYNNDQLVDVANVPLVDNKNGVWKIFTFNKGIYTSYNTIT